MATWVRRGQFGIRVRPAVTCCVAAGMIGIALLLTVVTVTTVWGSGDVGWPFLGASAAFVGIGIVGLRMRLEVGPDEVVVVNVRTVRYPTRSVVGVGYTYEPWVEDPFNALLVLDDGRQVAVQALEDNSIFRGPRKKMRKLVDELNAYLAASHR